MSTFSMSTNDQWEKDQSEWRRRPMIEHTPSRSDALPCRSGKRSGEPQGALGNFEVITWDRGRDEWR